MASQIARSSTMDAYRTPEPPMDGNLGQYVSAVMSSRADAMEYFFERLVMPPRPFPRAHLFANASPRVTLAWRPTPGDFLLSWISREALAGPWRITFDADVLGYAFDERVAWVREPSPDELAVLRGARLVL
jgi:hypothetical protein